MGLFRRRVAAPTAPPEVEVAGVRYRQHRTASPDPENASHLYLPPDEDPARFRRRVQLDVHTARGLTPATVLGHWLPLHAARHDGPAEMNHEVFTANDGSGEYLLDFLLSHHEAGLPAWEWNAVRVIPHRVGLVVLAWTHRAYGEEIDPFLTGLGAERPALLGRFMDAPVPEVTS
ncbi:hypothetical protein [Actinomycetospora sp. NBRC 106378]|uniref:hypothetical protein n=1 Tax=Actinomycetospora sp. NBRC 106378 TaxID=3032208 RepID=UPI0024A48F77|nr:hypothetical protein [Actinomycetospora sp. NBRC 106378]GLZ51324.1 hypothetical protein Acsp07_09410 [Actinomycetospora sp. NBRC 106378]